MRGSTAKRLRGQATKKNIEWYASLLTEEEAQGLTSKIVKKYTPVVSYYTNELNPTTYLVSQFTQRWFVLQEKKRYVRMFR